MWGWVRVGGKKNKKKNKIYFKNLKRECGKNGIKNNKYLWTDLHLNNDRNNILYAIYYPQYIKVFYIHDG